MCVVDRSVISPADTKLKRGLQMAANKIDKIDIDVIRKNFVSPQSQPARQLARHCCPFFCIDFGEGWRGRAHVSIISGWIHVTGCAGVYMNGHFCILFYINFFDDVFILFFRWLFIETLLVAAFILFHCEPWPMPAPASPSVWNNYKGTAWIGWRLCCGEPKPRWLTLFALILYTFRESHLNQKFWGEKCWLRLVAELRFLCNVQRTTLLFLSVGGSISPWQRFNPSVICTPWWWVHRRHDTHPEKMACSW